MDLSRGGTPLVFFLLHLLDESECDEQHLNLSDGFAVDGLAGHVLLLAGPAPVLLADHVDLEGEHLLPLPAPPHPLPCPGPAACCRRAAVPAPGSRPALRGEPHPLAPLPLPAHAQVQPAARAAACPAPPP